MEDLSRNEALLDALVNGTTPPEIEPKSRMEAYLQALLEKGVGGGSGGSGSGGAQADWEQNNENAPDYIKNRPFYTSDPVETVFFDGVVMTDGGQNMGTITFEVKEGVIYTVVIDGVQYEVVGSLFEEFGLTYIGNINIVMGGELLEGDPPFIYGDGMIIIANRDGDHAVKISAVIPTVHTIEEKYLPEDLFKTVGELTKGKTYIINDEEVVADMGAEVFNDYFDNIASGYCSHAEGSGTTASGYCSHAEGSGTTASGDGSHAEGSGTTASGDGSHAEGIGTTASNGSHAEGNGTTASGDGSHAEGLHTIAPYKCLSVSGRYNDCDINGVDLFTNMSPTNYVGMTASYKTDLHRIGSYIIDRDLGKIIITGYIETPVIASEVEKGFYIKNITIDDRGRYTTDILYEVQDAGKIDALYYYKYVEWKCRTYQPTLYGRYVSMVGNGLNSDTRSNAHTLDWAGNAWYAGTVEGTAMIVKSSTEGSTKRFMITVDDNGTITATVVPE